MRPLSLVAQANADGDIIRASLEHYRTLGVSRRLLRRPTALALLRGTDG